jgi:quinol monooxygenase YgiN
MVHAKWIVPDLVLAATLVTVALHAQEPPPKEAFKAVHLVVLTPAQEATLLTALADMNKSIAQAGHPEVRYRLYKVTGKQAGNYSYMWESSWPSGAVYDQVHNSPAFQAATKKHPEMDDLMKTEVYNRYVEVTNAKR